MALFKTIEEVQKYILVDVNLSWESFSPFIEAAEKKFIKDLLGDFYPVFLADYTDHTNANGGDTGMNPNNLTLLPYIQRALANYAAYQSVAHIGVSIGNEGIQENFGNNSRPASRWKVREVQTEYIKQGDINADILLEYLEDHATPSVYAAWYADIDANTAMSGLIVYKTAIASKFVDIHDSRRIFLKMKKRIIDIEENEIKRLLCNDQYAELIQQTQTGTLSVANKKLRAALEPYISKKALWLTVPFIKVNVTPEGLTIHSTNDGVVQKSAASKEDVADYRLNLKEGETGFESDWEKVDKFIAENIASYPLISASACWTSRPGTLPKYQVDNNPCNKHFSV